jgi:hypothetical protein
VIVAQSGRPAFALRAAFRRRTGRRLRHTLENLAEPGKGFELLAVSGETPRNPTGLIRQVRASVGFLASSSADLSDPDLGFNVDPAVTAARLGAGADGLDTVLTTLDRERKVAQSTRLQRRHLCFDGRGIGSVVGRHGHQEILPPRALECCHRSPGWCRLPSPTR